MFCIMRGRLLMSALLGAMLIAAGVFLFRALVRPGVTPADQMTIQDVDVIESDLNGGGLQWQVLLDAQNHYQVDVSRIGSAGTFMLCGTKTYFDSGVDHHIVIAMSPLNGPNGRQLACWTTSAGATITPIGRPGTPVGPPGSG